MDVYLGDRNINSDDPPLETKPFDSMTARIYGEKEPLQKLRDELRYSIARINDIDNESMSEMLGAFNDDHFLDGLKIVKVV